METTHEKTEYKTGDRVVIKPWKLMEKQYGQHPAHYSIGVDQSFTFGMEKCLAGTDRVVELGKREETLPGVFNGTGTLRMYDISIDMILGYAFAYGEEIEISDNGKDWHVRIFSTYDPMDKNECVRTKSLDYDDSTIGWKFARSRS